MTEAKDKKEEKTEEKSEKKPAKKTLGLSGKGTLSLNIGGSSGAARAAPATTRSNRGVAVEVRRKRSASQDEGAPEETRLTTQERDARARALELAKQSGGQTQSSLPKRHTIESKKKQEEAKKESDQSSRDKELEELRKIEEEENAKAAEAQAAAPALPDPDAPASRGCWASRKNRRAAASGWRYWRVIVQGFRSHP